MGSKISKSQAIKKAEDEAKTWYKRYKKGNTNVHNCGTEDFVTPDIEKSTVDAWKGKSTYGDDGELERRGSMSSGESKIDLKLAPKKGSKSLFNYHVWVKTDPAVEAARKKESRQAKKNAAEFKQKQEAAKKVAETQKKAEAKAKKELVAKQKKMTQAMAKDFNAAAKKDRKLKKDSQKKKKWEAAWMERNGKRYK